MFSGWRQEQGGVPWAFGCLPLSFFLFPSTSWQELSSRKLELNLELHKLPCCGWLCRG
jgi:hypothetical protein